MKKILLALLILGTNAFSAMDDVKCNHYKKRANEGIKEYKLSYEEDDKSGLKKGLNDFLYWNKKMVISCDEITAKKASKTRKQVRANPKELLSISISSVSQEESMNKAITDLTNSVTNSIRKNESVCKKALADDKMMTMIIVMVIKENDTSLSKEENTKVYTNLKNEYLTNNQKIINNCENEEVEKAKMKKNMLVQAIDIMLNPES